jgi:hypothetical protein
MIPTKSCSWSFYNKASAVIWRQDFHGTLRELVAESFLRNWQVQMVMKFPVSYGIQRFFTIFTWAYHWILFWAGYEQLHAIKCSALQNVTESQLYTKTEVYASEPGLQKHLLNSFTDNCWGQNPSWQVTLPQIYIWS